MLTKGEPFALPAHAPAGLGPLLERLWDEGVRKIVALGPQTPQTIAPGSDHYIRLHQPDLVVGATELLVTRAAATR